MPKEIKEFDYLLKEFRNALDQLKITASLSSKKAFSDIDPEEKINHLRYVFSRFLAVPGVGLGDMASRINKQHEDRAKEFFELEKGIDGSTLSFIGKLSDEAFSIIIYLSIYFFYDDDFNNTRQKLFKNILAYYISLHQLVMTMRKGSLSIRRTILDIAEDSIYIVYKMEPIIYYVHLLLFNISYYAIIEAIKESVQYISKKNNKIKLNKPIKLSNYNVKIWPVIYEDKIIDVGFLSIDDSIPNINDNPVLAFKLFEDDNCNTAWGTILDESKIYFLMDSNEKTIEDKIVNVVASLEYNINEIVKNLNQINIFWNNYKVNGEGKLKRPLDTDKFIEIITSNNNLFEILSNNEHLLGDMLKSISRLDDEKEAIKILRKFRKKINKRKYVSFDKLLILKRAYEELMFILNEISGYGPRRIDKQKDVIKKYFKEYSFIILTEELLFNEIPFGQGANFKRDTVRQIMSNVALTLELDYPGYWFDGFKKYLEKANLKFKELEIKV